MEYLIFVLLIDEYKISDDRKEMSTKKKNEKGILGNNQ